MDRYNPWWQNEEDEDYINWNTSTLKWRPDILKKIDLQPFSLNFLTGPRQVGKTTTLKIFINDLLQKGISPKSIFYYQCDELIDYKELGEVLDNYYNVRDHWNVNSSFILLDEITFVQEWWRAIKSRIDIKQMKNDILIITGSGSIELLKQKERFPGRRGNGQDLILLPLSFDKYISLFSKIDIKKLEITEIDEIIDAIKINKIFSQKIIQLFANYLECGGFPLSIIDFNTKGKIGQNTKRSYLDWLRSDWQKDNKNERYIKEIISYLIKSRLSPISWLSITKETSINSPHTIETYITTLENIYAVKVLYQIEPDFKINYKKNKKIHFIDPFIYRLMAEYTRSEVYSENIVESTVATHIARKIPTYYWKNKTEIDVIGIINNEQVGFEVKWGPKSWKKPDHLKKAHLLTKENIPLFLGTLKLN
ncbi:MAG: ATP-binding protein [Candidatus Helarchaeota archaeon]